MFGKSSNYTRILPHISIESVPLWHKLLVLDLRICPHRLPDEVCRELLGAVLEPGLGPLDLVLRYRGPGHMEQLPLRALVAVTFPSTLFMNHAEQTFNF